MPGAPTSTLHRSQPYGPPVSHRWLLCFWWSLCLCVWVCEVPESCTSSATHSHTSRTHPCFCVYAVALMHAGAEIHFLNIKTCVLSRGETSSVYSPLSKYTIRCYNSQIAKLICSNTSKDHFSTCVTDYQYLFHAAVFPIPLTIPLMPNSSPLWFDHSLKAARCSFPFKITSLRLDCETS